MDAAGAVDAQNAPTAPWKTAQNAVSHSAHTHHQSTRSTHEIADTPRGLYPPVRVLGRDPVRDPALRTEAANLLEVHVVQLFEEPGLLGLRELRQIIRHPQAFRASAPAVGTSYPRAGRLEKLI